MELNIIDYLTNVISQLTSRHHISCNSMKFLLLVIGLMIYTYILRSFSLPLTYLNFPYLSFAMRPGMGIHQKLRHLRGGQ